MSESYNVYSTDEEQRHVERVRDAQRIRERELEDVRWLMKSPTGRRLMWRLLEQAGIYRTTFTGDSRGAFLEGQRNVGLVFVADIHEACPSFYLKMITENRRGGRSNDTDHTAAG